MNWYNLLKLADKRNFLLQQGYDPQVVEWAVKLNNRYAVWLANMASQGTVRPGEDDEKLNSTLKNFEKAKKLRDFPHKDINQFKSYGDLVKALKPLLGQRTKGEQERISETEGAKLVLDQPPYRAFRLETPQAAAKLCRDTEWCVKDPKYYNQYIKDGPIYMVERDGKKFALAHYESEQFKDVYDEELDIEGKFDIIKLLKPVTGIDQTNNTELAYQYARHIIKDRFPEGEAAIGQDAEYSFAYARKVVKGRFPEGEAAIAQDRGLSYAYALYVIQDRFPEGEAIIAQDPRSAVDYARNVIKGRFPEGEAAIVQDAGFAYQYALYVIQKYVDPSGKFPEGEASIALNVNTAYMYAIMTNERFPEGEALIARSTDHAYYYAKDIIKGPWPEAGIDKI